MLFFSIFDSLQVFNNTECMDSKKNKGRTDIKKIKGNSETDPMKHFKMKMIRYNQFHLEQFTRR